jgi:hypothetical protein
MRTTTTRNKPTRMAKNGQARGKYCIWPMGDHLGKWATWFARPNNKYLSCQFRLANAGESRSETAFEDGTVNVRRRSRLPGDLCRGPRRNTAAEVANPSQCKPLTISLQAQPARPSLVSVAKRRIARWNGRFQRFQLKNLLDILCVI